MTVLGEYVKNEIKINEIKQLLLNTFKNHFRLSKDISITRNI